MSVSLIPTGNLELDYILKGGLPASRLYLLEGDPGTGKTSIGLQFLLDGATRGERTLHITLAETRVELNEIARSHGWDLSDLEIEELIPTDDAFDPDAAYTMYHPSEVELSDSLRRIFERAKDAKPTRVVVDSLSELRLLAGDPLRYRRQLMMLKRFFMESEITVILLDDRTGPDSDLQLHSLVHGVISLEQNTPEYGSERRRLRVRKLRGRSYRGGYHDFRIVQGGVMIYPRVRAMDRDPQDLCSELMPSGVEALDNLLGGGLHRATTTLLLGPSGVGKSTVALQYAVSAAQRGEKTALFLFDERKATLLARSDSLKMGARQFLDSGELIAQEFDPAEVSPGELAHRLHLLIENQGIKLFILDSLNGYLNAMPGQNHLLIQLHELMSVMSRDGVTTLMVAAQHGILGAGLASPVDASYLADALVLFRFFEAEGRVRRAISVVKKRSGQHERTIRELGLSEEHGVEVGPPLADFQGILSGQPTFSGSRKPLL